MASLEDLEARVAALEAEVRTVREDAAAARVLAGGADRDVSAFRAELRAHTATLNALRETQLEQGQAITELDRKMTDGFSTLNAGMTRIAELLERMSGPGGK